MSITDVCIRRSVLAWMIMGATILFGLVAATRIAVSQMPDVDSPNVSVSLSWPGAAPDEVERGLIEPLEQALAQVEGIQRIDASARVGSARPTAVFAIGRNIDLALQDVQAKVSQAQRKLPKAVGQPTISKSNPDDQPLLTIGVRGSFSRQILADVARCQVQQKLKTIPGVGQVATSGYLDRNIRIWVDEAKLIERNVTVNDITNALNRQVGLSYIEAITLAPARCARFLKHGAKEAWLEGVVNRAFGSLARFYGRALRLVLTHPWKVLAGSTVLTAGCFAVGLLLPSEFSPAQDQSRFSVRVTAPTGSDLNEADRYARRIEQILYKHPEVVCECNSASG